jgi:hypothetical protein
LDEVKNAVSSISEFVPALRIHGVQKISGVEQVQDGGEGRALGDTVAGLKRIRGEVVEDERRAAVGKEVGYP